MSIEGLSSKEHRNDRGLRRDRLAVWGVILAVLVLTSLPYLYGYLSSPPDKQFMGLMLDVPDHGQYLSWWRGFQEGLLVPNKLTPEANRPVFFNLLWWTLAQLSVLTGLGYAPLYQLMRLASGAAFLWTAFRICGLFLAERRWRWTAFLLIAFSSGLGWVLVAAKYLLHLSDPPFPLDVFIAEGNSFLCILGYPHFALAAAFILGAFELTWRGWQTRRYKYPVLAGLVLLLLGWQHAYDLILVYGIMGSFGIVVWARDRRFPWFLFWSGLIVAALSFAPGVYSYWLTSADPLWKQVLAQFANAGVYTPTPFHLLILMGFPLIVAALTYDGLIPLRHLGDELLFIKVWFLAGLVLCYVPTDFQVHMLNSWQVPVALLAARGLYQYIVPAAAEWLGKLRVHIDLGLVQRWAIAGLLLAVVPTNVYLWGWRFVELRRHSYPYYLYHDEVAALAWLDQHASDEDVILSSITIGQYVPAFTNSYVFLAHWAQTADYYDKVRRVRQFFDDHAPENARIETVRTFAVDYVFYGPAERAEGDYDPGRLRWLTQVFSTPQVTVYRVDHETLP